MPRLQDEGVFPALVIAFVILCKVWRMCREIVETKSLNRAVKRNVDRFPKDFIFQISSREWENLKYQIGAASFGHGGRRSRPYAFTAHGAIMVANVLISAQTHG